MLLNVGMPFHTGHLAVVNTGCTAVYTNAHSGQFMRHLSPVDWDCSESNCDRMSFDLCVK